MLFCMLPEFLKTLNNHFKDGTRSLQMKAKRLFVGDTVLYLNRTTGKHVVYNTLLSYVQKDIVVIYNSKQLSSLLVLNQNGPKPKGFSSANSNS